MMAIALYLAVAPRSNSTVAISFGNRQSGDRPSTGDLF
jgi:hypothetical protein